MKAPWRKMPGYGVLRFLYHHMRDRQGRSIVLLRLLRPQNLFQPYGMTRGDRYPVIFRLVRERTGDGPDRRILSFGCATGEEVLSLRRHFPLAAITGLDIDPHNIAVCRTRQRQRGRRVRDRSQAERRPGRPTLRPR